MRIVFTGPIGSGKSTMADAIRANPEAFAGTQFVAHLSFAEALRVEVMGLLKSAGIFMPSDSPALLRDPLYKLRYRPLLQSWGQLRRELNKDHWVNIVKSQLSAILREWENTALITADDCRYFNEFDLYDQHAFHFVRLAPGPDSPKIDVDHPSERDWPNFQHELYLEWAPVNERLAMIYQYFGDQVVWENVPTNYRPSMGRLL